MTHVPAILAVTASIETRAAMGLEGQSGLRIGIHVLLAYACNKALMSRIVSEVHDS